MRNISSNKGFSSHSKKVVMCKDSRKVTPMRRYCFHHNLLIVLRFSGFREVAFCAVLLVSLVINLLFRSFSMECLRSSIVDKTLPVLLFSVQHIMSKRAMV